jgi:hypothetical protein
LWTKTLACTLSKNLLLSLLTLYLETCQNVQLDDLRRRTITAAVKDEAKSKYQKMLASGMQLHSTSGIWLEDKAVDPDWLVIYAGQHQDASGKTFYDGFTVNLLSAFLMALNSN